MKNRIMKALAVLLAALLLTSCAGTGGGGENIPYDPGTPVPAPHNGVFSCEFGTLTFNGDGTTVAAELDNSSGLFGELPAGKLEGTYRFVSDLPPHGRTDVRYDTAHNLELTLEKDGEKSVLYWDLGYLSEDKKTFTIYIGAVTESVIPVVFDTDGGRVQALFQKQ